MLWSCCEYKADEATFIDSLFIAARLDKPVKITLNALQHAAARVCRKQTNLPPSVVAALKRVILARKRAYEFYSDNDLGHRKWLEGLETIQSQLRALQPKASKKPQPQREETSFYTPNFDNPDAPDALDAPDASDEKFETFRVAPPTDSSDTISYQESVEDTAIGCIFQSIVEIQRRVSDLWVGVMRGSLDFVTADQLANTARDLGQKSLSELELLYQWPHERHMKHARKIGLLDDGTTILKQSEKDVLCMMATTPGVARLHIYGFKPTLCQVDPSFYPPVIQHMMDQGPSGGLDRSLLRCMVEALEKSEEIKKSLTLKEKSIRYALYRTLFQLIYPTVTALNSTMKTAYELARRQGKKWKLALESHTFSPDPWTLCHILAQAVCLRNLTNLKFLAPHLPRLIFSQQFRKFCGLPEGATQIPQEFKNMFSSLPQTTAEEVRLAYIRCQKEPFDRLYKRIKGGIPLGWRYFNEGENILPTIYNLFQKPTNYLSLLDRLREVLCTDNRQELDITAFPAERLTCDQPIRNAGKELLDAEFQLPLILINQGFRFMFQAESLSLPKEVPNVSCATFSDPADPSGKIHLSLSEVDPSEEIFREYWHNNPIPTSVHGSCFTSGLVITEKEHQQIEIILREICRPKLERNVDLGHTGNILCQRVDSNS